VRARSVRQAKLAARHRHRGAPDLHRLDPLGGAIDAGVEEARPVDLGALADLDLLAESDPPVAREVAGQRPGGGAGGWIFQAGAWREGARLPLAPRAREAVDGPARQHTRERLEVRSERRHLGLAVERDVDVAWAIVVELDGQGGARDAKGPQES